jgi:hypothetical protein
VDHEGGPNVITRVIRRGSKSCQSHRESLEDTMLLVLKLEEGTLSQGMQVIS